MERSKTPRPSATPGSPQSEWATPPQELTGRTIVILLLIQEELKNRRLFQILVSQSTPPKKLTLGGLSFTFGRSWSGGSLRWLSRDNAFYKTDLLDIIMIPIGLNPRLSLQRNLCHTLLDKHSQRVVESAAELQREATRVYEALLTYAKQFGHPT